MESGIVHGEPIRICRRHLGLLSHVRVRSGKRMPRLDGAALAVAGGAASAAPELVMLNMAIPAHTLADPNSSFFMTDDGRIVGSSAIAECEILKGAGGATQGLRLAPNAVQSIASPARQRTVVCPTADVPPKAPSCNVPHCCAAICRTFYRFRRQIGPTDSHARHSRPAP